jgi:hypothetical protein
MDKHALLKPDLTMLAKLQLLLEQKGVIEKDGEQSEVCESGSFH